MEPPLVPTPVIPTPPKKSKIFLVISIVIVLLILCALCAWFFLKKPVESPAVSTCSEVPSTISINDFPYANQALIARTATPATSTYAYTSSVTAVGVTFKVPFDKEPKIQNSNSFSRISLQDKTILVSKPINIEGFKESITNTTCPQLKQDFLAWTNGKTDLEILKEVFNLTPAREASLSHDLFFSLLSTKGIFSFKRDTYEFTVGSLSVTQASQENGWITDNVFDASGAEIATIVFHNLSQEEADYVLTSLAPTK